MSEVVLRLLCYASGLAVASIVVAAGFVVTGVPPDMLDEVGPLAAMALLIASPFAATSWLRLALIRRLVLLTVSSATFWAWVIVVAHRSRGGVNFGVALLALLSPVIIGFSAVAIDRMLPCRVRLRGPPPSGGVPPNNSLERSRDR